MYSIKRMCCNRIYCINWVLLKNSIKDFEEAKELLEILIVKEKENQEKYYKPKKSEHFIGLFEEDNIIEKIKV